MNLFRTTTLGVSWIKGIASALFVIKEHLCSYSTFFKICRLGSYHVTLSHEQGSHMDITRIIKTTQSLSNSDDHKSDYNVVSHLAKGGEVVISIACE